MTSALKGDATAGSMNSLAATVRVIQGQLSSGRLASGRSEEARSALGNDTMIQISARRCGAAGLPYPLSLKTPVASLIF